MAEAKGVLIVAETADGSIAPISKELLGIGRKIANDLGEDLCAALVGSGVSGLSQDLIAFGADRVLVVDDPLLADYQGDSYAAAMVKVNERATPNVILMGQTDIGRDLAPRLAFRLKTGIAVDSIDLNVDPDSKLLKQTRPAYGGNALALYVCDATRPQMATIRPKTMSPSERDDSRKGEVVAVSAGLDASQIRTKVLKRTKEEVAGVKLEDAAVVVTGGRGLGAAENFRYIEELAKLLKGAVGATRAACDAGWISTAHQVGLSGKIVTPNLYVAVALSGSSQHMAGCSGSRNIVAINKDPDAPIFKAAQLGVVGDFKKVLPAFTEKVRELL